VGHERYPMTTSTECPYCGIKPAYFYNGATVHPHRCPICERADTHVHEGVMVPKACGPLISFWVRLFRWCWLKEAHLHCYCSNCHGAWITPPAGVKGDPILKKPTKVKSRFERDDVI
jgi:hypothetical protein